MRLKRVRIYGFKTFAERTEFDVDGSIIAVVGPNGCGKSNIVDAILWALGEGNPKHLRAVTSQDVIFNGSPRRKPLGYAEVALLFDNEDASLPIDTSEVQISRRLTRSGDSDYRINGRACRLKDILELLADSGLGRAGYAIVSQKEIDQALAASAEDRRAWVDEAAGVQRYRVRKLESLRRLEAAQTHLDRVGDLIAEIEDQREPMREEAEVAARYRSIRDTLGEIESGLLVVEVARAIRDVRELEGKIAESQRMADKELALAEDLEKQARTAGSQIGDLERSLEGLRSRQHQVLTDFERAVSALKLGTQRLEALDELERNLGEDAGTSAKRLNEAQAELQQATLEETTEKDRLEKTRLETAGANKEAQELAKSLQEIEARLADAREAHGLRLRRETEAEHRRGRIEEIKRELEGIQETLPDLEAGLKEAFSALSEAEAAFGAIESEIGKRVAGLRAMTAEDDRDGEASRKLLAERARLEGLAHGIEATIQAHEGLQQGARNVLEAADRGLLKGPYLPVGEAIEVAKEHAVAIDTALGGAANDLICDGESEAKTAIELLKAHRGGRATFQPISLMRPQEVGQDLRELTMRAGVIGRASDLVRCEDRVRPVIESLLGRVLVVEDLDTALKLGKTSGWRRMVTLEGELLHSSGAVTGGASEKQTFGLVQRKAELDDLAKRIRALDTDLKGFDKSASARQKARAQVEKEIGELQQKGAGAKGEVEDARSWHQSLTDEMNSTQKAKDRLDAEREKLEAVELDTLPDSDPRALEAERDGVLKALAARSADADQADARLQEAEHRLIQAQERLAQAERRLQNAKEHEQLRTRKLTNLEPERRKARAEIEAAEKARDAAAALRTAVGKELDEAQKKRQASLEASFKLNEQAKEARASAQKAGELSHSAELARARADTKRATSAERLMEEYGMTEEQALEKEHEVELPKDAFSLATRLRRELKAMGDVNVGAVEAYERLTHRFDELTAQRDDISGGIREVEAGIRELDGLTRDKFKDTFEKVKTAFSEVFQSIFKGGEGHVSLTQPDNLLESGIEIDVTLPGKKRQRLELLSGGERSLCAATFLFSLLKVKPSPLVILDEVDAPLDGRNVEKFVDLLNDFARTTQFLVITHNSTTIAAAPVWLGVTMQEPGVSTLAPVRMAEGRAEVATEAEPLSAGRSA
ncbi:MAG: chromosome segregation protein SMC [Armatimonadetes bacterium]|nr:chromosome segregation protein SMC [Armatimonadota bacterium]